MAIMVPAIKEQLFRIPAHRFKQGNRTVFTFALELAQLDSILPERVDEDVIKETNRRLTPSHAKTIERYLLEQDDWVLGSILLGIAPDAVQFKPFPDDDGNQSPTFGELQIPLNRMNALRLFDGQHRRRAIQDVLSGIRDKEADLARTVNEAKKNTHDPAVIKMLSNSTAPRPTRYKWGLWRLI